MKNYVPIKFHFHR